MDYVLHIIGYLSRRFLPRGRTRLARLLMRYGSRRDLTYRDEWGYRHAASLGDQMEAYGFTGVPVLPEGIACRVWPGDWAIDAGANVGLVTAHLCHLTGSRGRVWAIEPVPRNVERLQRLKDLNGLERLTILAGGLAAVSGSASLHLPAHGESAYASFTKTWDRSDDLAVTTWSLDDLVYRDVPDRPVAFVKLDVEGYEPQALRGAERTLRDMKPLVYCELNDILLRDAGSSSAALLEQFAGLGYRPVDPPPPLDGQVVDVLLAAR